MASKKKYIRKKGKNCFKTSTGKILMAVKHYFINTAKITVLTLHQFGMNWAMSHTRFLISLSTAVMLNVNVYFRLTNLSINFLVGAQYMSVTSNIAPQHDPCPPHSWALQLCHCVLCGSPFYCLLYTLSLLALNIFKLSCKFKSHSKEAEVNL